MKSVLKRKETDGKAIPGFTPDNSPFH